MYTRGIIIQSKTIFSNSSLPTTEEIEKKKISYWLEKLFNQAEGAKKEQEKIQTDATKKPQAQQTIKEQGVADAVKHHAEKEERNRQSIIGMVNNSNRMLLQISSVFPFDLFPTRIDIEETRVTITFRQFLTSQVHAIDLKEMVNILINNGVFFCTISHCLKYVCTK